MAAEEDDDSHIIASVRRILGEDASRPRPAPSGAPPPDVYELAPSMMIEPQAGGGRAAPPHAAPASGAESVPEDGELSPDLAAWASEWGDEEPSASPSEDVSVVPQAAPMLAAQSDARPAPPMPEPGIEAAPATTSPHPAPPPAADHPGADTPLVEPHTADAAGHAFGSLRDTLRAQKEAVASAALPAAGIAMSSHAGGPTIEEMIRQELRPLLKSWLDACLPDLVDRAVRAEIARIVDQNAD